MIKTMNRRSLLMGFAALATATPFEAALAATDYFTRAEIQRHVIGRQLQTSEGTWEFTADSTFVFQDRKGNLYGPHDWSWYGQNSIRSPRNLYKFYVRGGFIYIQSRGGSWKTQWRVE